MIRKAPRRLSHASEDRVQVGSYFGVDSGNGTLDHIIVGVLGGAVVATGAALFFHGNPIAIVGLGAASFALLYGISGGSGTGA